MGPDHPQKEIFYESKHGIAYVAHKDDLNMDRPKWIVGEDYHQAPTCATCHMSATKDQPVSHDVGMRISWNNRPILSIRPEISDAKMGLPGKDVPWQKRRANMQNVCLNCHENQWVENFYQQYDALIELYHEKFAKPGLELMAASKPLLKPAEFSNKLDFIWFEIWHHEGRRARHGASMMGPDYTHWHGTYELARNFYSEMVPELRAAVRTAWRPMLAVAGTNAVNAVGFYMLFVYITTYPAEDCVNWEIEQTEEGDSLKLVVLREPYEEEGKDPFVKESKTQYRVLRLSGGVYSQEVYRMIKGQNGQEEWSIFETITPTRLGKVLDAPGPLHRDRPRRKVAREICDPEVASPLHR